MPNIFNRDVWDHYVIELSLLNNSFLRVHDPGDVNTKKLIGCRKEGVTRLYRSKASLSGGVGSSTLG